MGKRGEGEAERCGNAVWCREAERTGQYCIHVWWIKIGRGTLGVSDPCPKPDCTARGSSTGEINPHNFWIKKPVGVGKVEETAGFSENLAQRAPKILKCTQTHSLWDSIPGQQLEGCQSHTGRGKATRNGASVGEMSRRQAVAQCSLRVPSPHRATKQWSWLPCPGDYLRLCPTQFTVCFLQQDTLVRWSQSNST